MRWFSIKRNILISLATVLLAAATACAQNGTTSLRGTVTDQKGSSVPGALVTLENASLGISVSMKSDKDGAYQFLELRPTTYTVTVTSPGFASIRQNGLQLLVATPRTEDFKMEVASVATTIEVTGTA